MYKKLHIQIKNPNKQRMIFNFSPAFRSELVRFFVKLSFVFYSIIYENKIP